MYRFTLIISLLLLVPGIGLAQSELANGWLAESGIDPITEVEWTSLAKYAHTNHPADFQGELVLSCGGGLFSFARPDVYFDIGEYLGDSDFYYVVNRFDRYVPVGSVWEGSVDGYGLFLPAEHTDQFVSNLHFTSEFALVVFTENDGVLTFIVDTAGFEEASEHLPCMAAWRR